MLVQIVVRVGEQFDVGSRPAGHQLPRHVTSAGDRRAVEDVQRMERVTYRRVHETIVAVRLLRSAGMSVVRFTSATSAFAVLSAILLMSLEEL